MGKGLKCQISIFGLLCGEEVLALKTRNNNKERNFVRIFEVKLT